MKNIEFDASKDASNKSKHGVSLAKAGEVDWDSALVWVDQRFPYDEIRMIALGSLCITQRERMTCESRWDARQVLQPIADAMGKKSNAADRPNRALSRREELCRGSLAPETNVLYYIAFVERGETRRVVSLRRANRSEVKHYVENV